MRKDRIYRSGAKVGNFQGATDAVDPLDEDIAIGVVRAEDGDTHFEIEDGNVWVDVVIMPTESPVTCRLTTVAGGPGNGVWMVPPDGTEVVVAFPRGNSQNGGIIIAVLPAANLPEGVAAGQIVIVGPKVLVYDTDSGDANPVATKADIDALASHINGHRHDVPLSPGPSSIPTDTPPAAPVGLPDSSPVAAGTLVFEAE